MQYGSSSLGYLFSMYIFTYFLALRRLQVMLHFSGTKISYVLKILAVQQTDATLLYSLPLFVNYTYYYRQNCDGRK